MRKKKYIGIALIALGVVLFIGQQVYQKTTRTVLSNEQQREVYQKHFDLSDDYLLTAHFQKQEYNEEDVYISEFNDEERQLYYNYCITISREIDKDSRRNLKADTLTSRKDVMLSEECAFLGWSLQEMDKNVYFKSLTVSGRGWKLSVYMYNYEKSKDDIWILVSDFLSPA